MREATQLLHKSVPIAAAENALYADWDAINVLSHTTRESYRTSQLLLATKSCTRCY